MKSREIKISETDAFQWEEFLLSVRSYKFFVRKEFVGCYDIYTRFFLCFIGAEAVAGFSLNVTDSGDAVKLPYQSYNGILFRDLAGYKQYRVNEIKMSVGEAIADFMDENFNRFELENSPDVVDFRPFLWKKNIEGLPVFDFQLRYTVLSHIERPEDFSGFNEIRRRNIRKSEKYDLVFREKRDPGIIADLQLKTFDRQGISWEDPDKLDAIRRIVSVGLTNVLQLNAYLGSSVISSLFIGFDENIAYFIFGGTDPEFRNTEVGTRIFIEAFKLLFYRHHIEFFDWIGVNSPDRGGFKMSFGGQLQNYVTLRRLIH